MKKVINLLVSSCMLMVVVQTSVIADSRQAIQAFKNFALSYAKLPNGVCSSKSLSPYILALRQLERFETLAENISNVPDLSEHRHFLADVISSRETCFNRNAGIAFRCDGPCPSMSENLGYKEAIKLPDSMNLGMGKNLSVNGRNVYHATYDHRPGMGLKNHYGKEWYEYDESGRKMFTFEEVARDDWSVYLNDKSRDVQLQIDLHRMWISYGEHNGPRRDLYKIRLVESL